MFFFSFLSPQALKQQSWCFSCLFDMLFTNCTLNSHLIDPLLSLAVGSFLSAGITSVFDVMNVFFFSELIPHTVHSLSIVQNILHYFYCWGKCNSNICQGKWQLQKCAVDPNVLRVIVVSRSFINWYSHAVCQHAGIQKEGNVSECRSRRVVIYTFLLQQFSNFLLSGEVAWSVSDLARGLFTRWSVKTLATQSVSKEQECRKKFIVSCCGNAPPFPQEQLYFIVNAM